MVMATSMSLLGLQQLDEAIYWYTPYFYETNVEYRCVRRTVLLFTEKICISWFWCRDLLISFRNCATSSLLRLIIKYNAGYVTKRRRPDFVLPDLVPVSHANPCQEQLWVDVSRDKKESLWSYRWWRDRVSRWKVKLLNHRQNVHFNFSLNLVSRAKNFCIKFFTIQKNIQSWIKNFRTFHKRR